MTMSMYAVNKLVRHIASPNLNYGVATYSGLYLCLGGNMHKYVSVIDFRKNESMYI